MTSIHVLHCEMNETCNMVEVCEESNFLLGGKHSIPLKQKPHLNERRSTDLETHQQSPQHQDRRLLSRHLYRKRWLGRFQSPSQQLCVTRTRIYSQTHSRHTNRGHIGQLGLSHKTSTTIGHSKKYTPSRNSECERRDNNS